MAQALTNSSGTCSSLTDVRQDASCSNNILSSGNREAVTNAARNIFPYNSPKHSLTDYRQQGGSGKFGTTSDPRSRPPLPVASATHYSDSGFGSTFSSGSGSSYLPPPPPYRMNVRRQQRIHRSLSDSKYGTGGTMDSYTVSSRGSWGFSRSPSPSMSTVSCPEYGELQDRLQRLVADRESLSLQVSVLTEQVGAQTEKIKDLESLLEDKRQKLDNTEEMLQDELVTRTSLETNKLDLMAEVSNLKLKFASIERDKLDTEHKLRTAQIEINQLQKITQNDKGEWISNRGGYPSPSPRTPVAAPSVDQGEINQLVHKLRLRSKEAGDEIEQLRMAVQQLISVNMEKEHHIEQLKSLVDRQVQQQARMTSMHRYGNGAMEGVPRSASAYATTGMIGQNGGSHVTEGFDINDQLRRLLSEEAAIGMYFPNSASYPEGFSYSFQQQQQQPSNNGHGGYPGPSVQSSSSYTSSLSAMSAGSPLTWSGAGTPRHLPSQHLQQMENAQPASSRSPVHPPASPAGRQLAAELDELAPQFRRHLSTSYHTGSLPRNIGTKNRKKKPSVGSAIAGEWKPPRAPARGLKWLRQQLRPSKRSTSAPNLADSDEGTIPSGPPEKFKRDKKQRSLRNLLGRLKRSNSQELNDPDLGDGTGFRRGQLTRATAGPRLAPAWSVPIGQHIPLRPPTELFLQWSPDQLADWLTELGLNMYAGDARKVIQSGRHMLTLTQHEMEKDLAMKNPLHRKKLILALRAIERGKAEAHDKMDSHQVLRWLDDVGLPQYRDAFAENRIDGQVLDALTVEDLLLMKVTCALHHAAIGRGVQLLRMIGFNPNRFQRKFDPESIKRTPCPITIQMWSQHCVSEWLRTIDLTEFTPNLMCAGIHGALMVLEPTFTAESLAEVLRMPMQKTLLRRHLSTHFNQLLGNDIIAGKREALTQPFALQLTPALKIRPLKKGFSLSRKKSKTEVYMEPDEPICPMTPTKVPLRDTESAIDMPLSELMLQNLESSNV